MEHSNDDSNDDAGISSLLCLRKMKETKMDKLLKTREKSISILISAPRESGKTFLMMNSILPRLKSDVKILFTIVPPNEEMRKTYDRVYDSLDALPEILKLQQKHKDKRMLIVFDDMIYGTKAKENENIIKITCMGRHINISSIIISQDLMQVSRQIRNNINLMFVFRSDSRNIETVIDFMMYRMTEINAKEAKKKAYAIYAEAVKEKYQCLIIDFDKTDSFYWFRSTRREELKSTRAPHLHSELTDKPPSIDYHQSRRRKRPPKESDYP